MKINTQSPLKVLLLGFIFILHLSCSKDSDLLADYVLTDVQEVINGKYVVDDTFMVSQNGNTVLDVLSNDGYTEQDNVSIKETSAPTNGSVEINTNNTITYTPYTVEETPVAVEETAVTVEEQPVTDAVSVDTFTYTTEVVNEDQSVTTEEGTVTIVITPEASNFTNCVTNGGLAGDTGLKTWCWGDITLPAYSGNTGVSFSNKELSFATECDEKSVFKDGDQLVFALNPTTPPTEGWCSRDYNMRAEISTLPWPIRHPLKTEEWFGWNYTFGNDYIIDRDNEWLFFQVHNGVSGLTPLFELMITRDGLYGASAGEIFVKNNANTPDPDRVATGVTPVAGQTIKVVVHVIWDNASNGLLQVWIDDSVVYDKQIKTVYDAQQYGGNAKWGIYKWPWSGAAGVQKSTNQGITHLQTFMGPLRMITRRPGDVDYGKDSYSMVAPR